MSVVIEDIERIAWKWKMVCKTCVHFRADASANDLAKRVQRELSVGLSAELAYQMTERENEVFGICLATTVVTSPQAIVCAKYRQSVKPLGEALKNYVAPPRNVVIPPFLVKGGQRPNQLYSATYTVAPENGDSSPTCTVAIKPMPGATLQDARPYMVEVTCTCGWRRADVRLASKAEGEFVGIGSAKRHIQEAHQPEPVPGAGGQDEEVEGEIDGIRFRNVERSKQ